MGRPAASVRWLGHATCEVTLGGTTLLTDPVLRRQLWLLRRAGGVHRPSIEPGSIDAVLVSHAHHDHLDLPSLRQLGRDVHVIAPPGADRVLRRAGFTHVTRLARGERVDVGEHGVTVRAVHAEHPGARGGRRPRGDEQAVGYVLAAPGAPAVWFAGDTALDERLHDARDADVALVPVGGWWRTLGPGHLDGRAAAEVLRLVQPRVAIPIHWGTLHPLLLGRAALPAIAREPDAFAARARLVVPEVDVRVLEPGGALALDAQGHALTPAQAR